MRRLCAILTATTLIGGLAACSSSPEGSGDHTGNGGQAQQHDERQRPAYLTAANALSADQDAVLADMQAPAGERTHDYERRAVIDALRDHRADSAEEWTRAILDQVHADNGEAVRTFLEYTPVITTDAGPDGTTSGQSATGEQPATSGTPEPQRTPGGQHVAVVLDASGSMAAAAGGTTRMAQAKTAIGEFVARLPATTTVSLRTYGEEGGNSDADKATSCASTRLAYEGAPSGMASALQGITPTGWTPMAAAVRASTGDIPADSAGAIVYVVSDGIETCDGDPVAAVKEVAATGAKPIVNVIGFQVGRQDHEQLKAMAHAGGGQFVDAQDLRAMRRYWNDDAQRISRTWRNWRQSQQESIRQQREANSKRVTELHDQIVKEFDTERGRATEVATGLRQAGVFDAAMQQGINSELRPRRQAMWRWTSDRRSDYQKDNNRQHWDAYLDTSRLSREQSQEAYDRARKQFREYYQQSRP